MSRTIKSSLEKCQETSPLSDEELFNKKRKAWQCNEGFHLNTEQIKKLPQDQQWSIEIIGNSIYGKKHGKH